MSVIEEFNSVVFVSEQLSRLMVNAAQELAQRVVSQCAEHYNFDSMEAIRLLGLENVKLVRKPTGKTVEKRASKPKVVVAKPSFPLPFNGLSKQILWFVGIIVLLHIIWLKWQSDL